MLRRTRGLIPCTMVLLAGLGLTACAPRAAPTPKPHSSIQDLVEALVEAGAEVQQTSIVASGMAVRPGQVLQVNAQQVEVYEFPDAEQRQQVSQAIAAGHVPLAGLDPATAGRTGIWASGSLIVIYDGDEGGVYLLLDGLLPERIAPPVADPDEPFPPAVIAAMRLLASELGVDPSALSVVDYQEVEWNDGCLGAPSNGEGCIQVITPGWKISLRYQEQDYLVHSDSLGENLRRP